MKQLSPLRADVGNTGPDRQSACRLGDGKPLSAEVTTPANPISERDKARRLDQFYTRTEVVEDLVEWYRVKRIEHNLLRFQRTRIIEPSAGTGAFLRKLPFGSAGYDIDPKASGIRQGDFLALPLSLDDPLLVIGNPPFGKNASMAIKFFNHAAGAADVIAFIVPRTFQKVSVQNRLDLSFHLIDEMAVPKDAFIFEGKRKHVPAVFQIWVRKDVRRQKIALPKAHADFEFLRAGEAHKANFAIQRVGADAGQVHHNLEAKPSAHYFVRATPEIDDLEDAMCRLRLDFEAMAQRTAGKPSLAKTEVVQLYMQFRTSRSDEPEARPECSSPDRRVEGKDAICN
ncbi:SAM-dependent methyltransferase [Erythrobacter westpacificensis]|uniref:SAM-dependent methyltransferase n=1 Tax=Erythrobacter westpacificensis TaxID=1055231 RepID=UPI0031F83439